MLLILTNSGDATSDYLQSRLAGASIDNVRLDTDRLSTTYELSINADGATLKGPDNVIRPHEISNVWFRRPGPITLSSVVITEETKHLRDEWSEALEGFLAQIPMQTWVNHPANNAMASHKIEQLARANRMGLTIPDTLVTQSPDEAQEFFYKHNKKVVVKPLAFGFVERNGGPDSVIYTNALAPADLNRISSIANCPTLLQQEISKQRDVRITIVDDDIHAVSLIAMDSSGHQRVDIRRDNMQGVQYELTDIPANVLRSVQAYHKSYGLRFSAIDMAVDQAGNWTFFEINPNGQWAWTDLLRVTDIAKSFIKSFRI